MKRLMLMPYDFKKGKSKGKAKGKSAASMMLFEAAKSHEGAFDAKRFFSKKKKKKKG